MKSFVSESGHICDSADKHMLPLCWQGDEVVDVVAAATAPSWVVTARSSHVVVGTSSSCSGEFAGTEVVE